MHAEVALMHVAPVIQLFLAAVATGMPILSCLRLRSPHSSTARKSKGTVGGRWTC